MWEKLIYLATKKENIQPPVEDGKIDLPNDEVFKEVAEDLEIELDLLKAFVKVESGSQNDLNGRVIIRWEPHIFKRYSKVQINVHGSRGRINDECQGNEYEAFRRGCSVEKGKWKEQAYMSASWGMGQIMGFHYKRLKFISPQALAEWIGASDDNGIRSIGQFIATNSKLLKACRTKDYHRIAVYYNGGYYEKYAPEGQQYDDKIKREYERLTAGKSK